LRETEGVIDRPWFFIYPPAGGFSSTGICAALEREDAFGINRVVQKWLSTNPLIDTPAHIPERRGALTISDIHSASDADEHIKRVGQGPEMCGVHGLNTSEAVD
jgi:hypothetical protein